MVWHLRWIRWTKHSGVKSCKQGKIWEFTRNFAISSSKVVYLCAHCFEKKVLRSKKKSIAEKPTEYSQRREIKQRQLLSIIRSRRNWVIPGSPQPKLPSTCRPHSGTFRGSRAVCLLPQAPTSSTTTKRYHFHGYHLTFYIKVFLCKNRYVFI